MKKGHKKMMAPEKNIKKWHQTYKKDGTKKKRKTWHQKK